jgi:hypothetical protein
LAQPLLAKLLIDLGFHVLIVALTNAALQAISKTIFEKMPKLNASWLSLLGRLMQTSSAKENEQTSKENIDYSMFCLLQSMAAVHDARYNVIPEHDLQAHVANKLGQTASECIPKVERR